jgi:hypothetical protein
MVARLLEKNTLLNKAGYMVGQIFKFLIPIPGF